MKFPFECEQGLSALRNARSELAGALAVQQPAYFLSLAGLSPLIAAVAYAARGEETTINAAAGMLKAVDRSIAQLTATGTLGLAVVNEHSGALEAWVAQANRLGSALTQTTNMVEAELGLSAQVSRIWKEVVIPTAVTARDAAKKVLEGGTSLLELVVLGAIAVAVIYVARAAR